MEPIHVEHMKLYWAEQDKALEGGFSLDAAGVVGQLAIIERRPDLGLEQVMPYLLTGNPEADLTARQHQYREVA